MKKGLLLILALTLMVSVIFADQMQPGIQKREAEIKGQTRLIPQSRPEELEYSFSVNPVTILLNYYDYMVGSYNDLPLCIQPDPTYGGFWMTFHGTRLATSQRRVFYAYLNDNGVVQSVNEVTNIVNREGYPGIAVDPVSGKPIYAWHANADADGLLEVQLAYDAFLFGSEGLLSDPVVVINNPYAVPGYTDTDNEFIWPTVKIGPSPTAGMRRVYVLARNATTHTTYPSENVVIAYADFDADMLELGSTLTWSYTTIPTLDAWNHDTAVFRRPNMSFAVGNDGRIYYAGYHIPGLLPDGDLVEPDLDVFVCDNYGAGTWTRVVGNSVYPSWNPKLNYGSGPGYFDGSDNTTPVPDDSLFWSTSNSSHLNTVFDATNNKLHYLSIFAQQFREMENGLLNSYYHPSIQTMKSLIYDVDAETFVMREVYPIAGESHDDALWLPWDADGDGLVDEYFTNPDDPNDPSNGYPLLYSTWPFPHWDSAIHNNAMMFHYNNAKITPPNEYGMMAAVWQDSNRARLYNNFATNYPELAAFADTPEMWISCSSDFGHTWSEPIVLNKVETLPQFANIKPMWCYPADYIKYVGVTPEGRKIGKLAIMFYDDISWGSYSIEGPVGQNDGGYVKFMELQINFPFSTSNNDPVVAPAITMLKQNYPNPFNPETTISFNMPRNGFANLSVYNTKGQLVKTLVNGMMTAGDYRQVWNGKDNNGSSVASGIYFYKLNANGRTETRKMMLMK